MRVLVTGCGRSGTNYLASVLSAAGHPCGHEKAFGVFGYTGTSSPWESSWYAAPFIEQLPELTHVVHMVRDPRKVVASFYRIGLCAGLPIRHITGGHPLRFLRRVAKEPQFASRRTRYVLRHRRYLKRHTTCFAPADEIQRLFAYWTQWNQMVEKASARREVPYLRVRLEAPDTLPRITEFLGLETELDQGAPTNKKSGYRSRHLPDVAVPEATRTLAIRYGYALEK